MSHNILMWREWRIATLVLLIPLAILGGCGRAADSPAPTVSLNEVSGMASVPKGTATNSVTPSSVGVLQTSEREPLADAEIELWDPVLETQIPTTEKVLAKANGTFLAKTAEDLPSGPVEIRAKKTQGDRVILVNTVIKEDARTNATVNDDTTARAAPTIKKLKESIGSLLGQATDTSKVPAADLAKLRASFSEITDAIEKAIGTFTDKPQFVFTGVTDTSSQELARKQWSEFAEKADALIDALPADRKDLILQKATALKQNGEGLLKNVPPEVWSQGLEIKNDPGFILPSGFPLPIGTIVNSAERDLLANVTFPEGLILGSMAFIPETKVAEIAQTRGIVFKQGFKGIPAGSASTTIIFPPYAIIEADLTTMAEGNLLTGPDLTQMTGGKLLGDPGNYGATEGAYADGMTFGSRALKEGQYLPKGFGLESGAPLPNGIRTDSDAMIPKDAPLAPDFQITNDNAKYFEEITEERKAFLAPTFTVDNSVKLGDNFIMDNTVKAAPDFKPPVTLKVDPTYTPPADSQYISDFQNLPTATPPPTTAATPIPRSDPAPTPTTGQGDTTPPRVTILPANGATDIAVNSPITATFNEPMIGSTITASTFTVATGGTNVLGTVVYDAINRTATFSPPANLANNTTYTVTITTGVKDSARIALAANATASFTTVAAAADPTPAPATDTTAPQVSSGSPVNSATNVAVNTAVTVTFDEAMDSSTITGTTFTVAADGTNVGGTVSVAANNLSATFTPSANLSYSTVYTVTVTTGAKDTAGNALAAYSASFTTGAAPDTTLPTVSSVSPVNSATNVAVNTAVTVTFDEAMDSSTITGTTFTVAADGTNVGGTVSVAANNLSATFTPTANLSYSTVYTVTITTGAKDAAGNGLAANYTSSFTTALATPSAPTATGAYKAVDLTWTAVTGATKYNLYFSTTTGVTKTNGTKIADLTGTSHSHTGRSNGVTYYYIRTAVDSAGNETAASSQNQATAQFSWTKSTIVPSTDNVFQDHGTALALDATSKVHFSFYDTTSDDLKYATNASGAWVVSTVDSNGDVGSSSSLAVDSQGKIYVSYYDITNADLKYASKPSGGDWAVETVDSQGSVGASSALTLDSNEKVHIAYSDGSDNLKYITNSSGAWVISTADSSGSAGRDPSIALDSNGKVHIIHHYIDLKYSTNASGQWVTSVVDSVPSEASGVTSLSMRLDNSGKVHIGHKDGGTAPPIRYSTNSSGSWTTVRINNDYTFGSDKISTAIDSNGKIHIAYSNGRPIQASGQYPGLAYATNASGVWVTTSIETSAGDVGYPSIAIDSQGKLHISYLATYSGSAAFGSVKYVTGD